MMGILDTKVQDHLSQIKDTSFYDQIYSLEATSTEIIANLTNWAQWASDDAK